MSSSSEESPNETLTPAKQLKLCKCCNKHVSDRTFYRHKKKQVSEKLPYQSSKEYCSCCNKFVSISTLKRHQNKLKRNHVEKVSSTEAKLPRMDSSSDEENLPQRKPTSSSSSSEIEDTSAGQSAVIEEDIDENSGDDTNFDIPEPISDEEAIDEADTINVEEFGDMINDVENEPIQPTEQPNSTGDFVRAVLMAVCVLQCFYYLNERLVEDILFIIRQLLLVISENGLISMSVITSFPISIYGLRKYLKYDKDDYTKYIIYKNCAYLYKYNEVVFKVGNRTHAVVCTNPVYRSRVTKGMPKTKVPNTVKYECKGSLVREVKNSKGEILYYPYHVYCYQSVERHLKRLVKSDVFIENCKKWRNRDIRRDTYCDVYDGAIWREYVRDGFFDSDFSFGVMLNVDWFQPFKRRSYSVGVIYLVFMNLPRAIRFKKENVLLVGIIPNLSSEPSLNTFLTPFVDEMIQLWNGIEMNGVGNSDVTVKVALLCAAADIPAARKLCGFMGPPTKMQLTLK